MNILFIMYDQLRFDYLSCAGHPHLQTPNFDRVAAMGVRFTNAYVQSPVCGGSRMCYYTGRYASSHGAQWNGFPLRVGEITIGDHLRKAGMECWLIGKTHMKADAEGMARLGLSPDTLIGARQAECGFDTWIRDDGLWGQGPDGFYDEKRSPYNEYLKGKGYPSENPWADFANAGIDEDGDMASGWIFKNADKAANVREEDSETPWLTSKTIEFIDEKDGPWMAHVSYIKPHWPYIVPAPYHDMYSEKDIISVKRSDAEFKDPHPLMEAYYGYRYSQAFRRDDVRNAVIPAYMGLITQIDDQIGRLMTYLEDSGQLDETLIVFTSDHGDYLGDHWMGEKDLFHDPSARIPMIIVDPSKNADATRGQIVSDLTEAIDLAPTFVEYFGGTVPDHILEGRSLLPALRGRASTPRGYVISEYDYSTRSHLRHLSPDAKSCLLTMVFDGRWKMVWVEGHRPMLYDLKTDPDEFIDLGNDEAYSSEITRLSAAMFDWARRQHNRVTLSDEKIDNDMCHDDAVEGVYLGFWDEEELAAWKAENGPKSE